MLVCVRTWLHSTGEDPVNENPYSYTHNTYSRSETGADHRYLARRIEMLTQVRGDR